MPSYRLYSLTPTDSFSKVTVVDCADNSAALEAARIALAGSPGELWDRTRMIGRLNAGEVTRRIPALFDAKPLEAV